MIEYFMHAFHMHIDKEIKRKVHVLCIIRVIVKLYAIGEGGGGEAQETN